MAYAYGDGNPLVYADPNGEEITLASLWAAYKFEQKYVKPINNLLEYVEAKADVYAGAASNEEAEARIDAVLSGHTAEKLAAKVFLESQGVPGAGFAAGFIGPKSQKSFFEKAVDLIPGKQAIQVPYRVGRIVGDVAIGTLTRAVDWASGNINSSGQANNNSGNQSLSSRTATAGSYAQNVTAQTQTKAAPNSSGNGTTTQSISSGGNSSSSGSAFTRVVNSVQQAATSVTQAVRNAAATVAQAVSSAVRSVGNFFSGLFGGRRP